MSSKMLQNERCLYRGLEDATYIFHSMATSSVMMDYKIAENEERYWKAGQYCVSLFPTGDRLAQYICLKKNATQILLEMVTVVRFQILQPIQESGHTNFSSVLLLYIDSLLTYIETLVKVAKMYNPDFITDSVLIYKEYHDMTPDIFLAYITEKKALLADMVRACNSRCLAKRALQPAFLGGESRKRLRARLEGRKPPVRL